MASARSRGARFGASAAAATFLAAVVLLLLAAAPSSAQQPPAAAPPAVPADPATGGGAAVVGASGSGVVRPLVVGGEAAPRQRFRHQIGLLILYWYCGGSLIRPDVVMTAAHCVTGPTPAPADVTVVAGAYAPFYTAGYGGGTTFAATKIVVHPAYNPNTNSNDVALIYLNGCVTAANSNGAAPAMLAVKEQLDAFAAAGGTLMLSGWGTTGKNADSDGANGDDPTVLQVGYAKYVPNKDCAAIYSGYASISSSMLCAGGVKAISGTTPDQDTCQGDSGGPVTLATSAPAAPLTGAPADDVVVGITSWGFGCGQSGQPGVYSNVPALRSWIVSQVDARAPACAAPAFVQAAAATNWAGVPLTSIKADATNAVAACQAKCAARGACVAFSISIKPQGKSTTKYCDLFSSAMLCSAAGADKKNACALASSGAWRVSY